MIFLVFFKILLARFVCAYVCESACVNKTILLVCLNPNQGFPFLPSSSCPPPPHPLLLHCLFSDTGGPPWMSVSRGIWMAV